MEAGKDHGLKPFGIRAMESLRVEKTYKLVGTEMSIEYAAFESGLERFVHLNKGNFIGRDSLVKWQQNGFKNKMVTLEVHDVEDADALGNNPIYNNGKVIGRATGGNYGFRVKKSLAIGMVDPQFADIGQKLEMDILVFVILERISLDLGPAIVAPAHCSVVETTLTFNSGQTICR